MTFTSRAAVRRALTQLPDAARTSLASPFATQAGAGPLSPDEVIELLSTYLLDPRTGAILATTDERAEWLAGPLFTWVGPGNAAPVDDQVAALIVAPVLGRGGVLSPLVTKHRFAPRADDLVALSVAALDLPAQAAALEQLFGEPGPEPETLALSIVQCGRVLAWAPHLLEWPIAEHVVTALIALLDPSRPAPLLDAVAAALGPIASRPGPLAQRVRTAAKAGLDAAITAKPASFSAQVAAIGKQRVVPDKYLELPRREVASACAYILGFASPLDREGFIAHRAIVIDRPDASALSGPFVDGLVAAGHVPAISELVASMLTSEDGDVGLALALASRLPLDPIAPLLVEQLDSPSDLRRAVAIGAIEMLETTEDADVEAALAQRLSDPSPEVCAAAVRTLLVRGRRDIVAKHSAREANPLRRAVVLAGLGELTVPVVGEIVRDGIAGLPSQRADEDEDDPPSQLTQLLAESLLCTVTGIDVAADLIGGVPDAAGLLALASLPFAERDIGVLAPPLARAHLAQVTTTIGGAMDGDDELAALALYLMARISAGDEVIANLVASALTASDGYAGNLIAALGEVRVANEQTAAALAPFVDPEQAIGGRVIAAAVCGRALPPDHAAWAHVRELLELGTIARASAWSALRDRARRNP